MIHKSINFLSRKIATLPGFIGLFVVLSLCIKLFTWRTKRLMFSAENKLLDSRFWYTPNDVQSFFAYIDSNVSRSGLNLYAITQITLDIIFPIAYGTLLATLIVVLYRDHLSQKLILIPALAAAADIGENITTAILAWSYSGSSSPLAWIALVFTLTKWVMIFSSLLVVVREIVLSDNVQTFWKDYIFPLRIPIIFGLLLFFFPILANTIAARLIQNLFVMRGFWQLVIVMIGAAMAALMVSFSFERIFERVSSNQPLNDIQPPVRYAFVAILVIFNWVPVLCLSSAELKRHSLGAGLLIGLTLSVGLAILIEKFGNDLGEWLQSTSETVVKQSLTITGRYAKASLKKQAWRKKPIVFLRLAIRKLKNQISKMKKEDFLGISLGFFSGVIYLAIYFIYQPGSDVVAKIGEAPALLYVYLLIWVLTGIFSNGTFYFDRFHVPFLILLILLSGFGYAVFQVDHKFKLEYDSSGEVAVSQIQSAIDRRLQIQSADDESRTLVIVSASGGGIQASGWTAQVLGGLQEELGASFTQAIGLISSVSGGSVGTMYFIDNFDDEHGYPADQNIDESKKYCLDKNLPKFKTKALNNTFCNATEDWLDAVGWGAAYPDLIRLTGWLSPLVDKYNDRGYALEHDWQMKMRDPKTETFLSDWRRKSLRGEIPIPVFNATLVEDGRRFLISPMKFVTGTIIDLINDDDDRKVLDFPTLYPDFDLNVTTAARLSATFPYVSPLPRNDKNISYDIAKNEKFYGNYHIADGGYFDGSGLFTAIELIDERFDSFVNDLKIKRFLFLQINAFPKSKLGEGSKGDQAWLMESIGPLTAAYAVRDSTQISRNLKEIELLKKRVDDRKQEGEQKTNDKQKIEIESFIIYFPEENTDKPEPKPYNQPLSWRLTQQQKINLKLAWQDVLESSNFQKLKKLWQDDWNIPSEWKTENNIEQ